MERTRKRILALSGPLALAPARGDVALSIEDLGGTNAPTAPVRAFEAGGLINATSLPVTRRSRNRPSGRNRCRQT